MKKVTVQIQKPEREGGALFTYTDLKKATTIKWFERIALWFIKKQYQVNETEGHTLVYKIWRGKVYILNEWINHPKHYNMDKG